MDATVSTRHIQTSTHTHTPHSIWNKNESNETKKKLPESQ